MKLLQDARAIFLAELTLLKRFPKLRVSAIGVTIIPALYAFIYLASVRDPSAHMADLHAAVVNLDKGVVYREQSVNIGADVVKTLGEKQTFGFVPENDVEEAKASVRRGQRAFALIIPADFSANAVPGNQAAGGKLQIYISEGNNYNAAGMARRFASELGHQVNIKLNEKRWSLVLTTAAGSVDKVTQLREGVNALQKGAHQLEGGLKQADAGSAALAQGNAALGSAVEQLTDGVKQIGGGLRTMDQQRPADKDLAALKAGAADLASGHVTLGQGLQDLQAGSQKLAEGAAKMRDETRSIPIVGGKVSDGAGQLATGAGQLQAGLQSAQKGQAQLMEGAQKLSTNVAKLTDGMGVMGNGVHTMATKLPADAKLDELAKGAQSAAQGAKDLSGGVNQLHAGSRELAGGMDMLVNALPKDITLPDGNPLGLADSVEPEIEVVAPVPNSGAGFAPNFLASSLWLGAVMSAFLVHLRRLPIAAAQHASAPARLLGKFAPLGAIVTMQSFFIFLMSIFVLGLPVVHVADYALTLVTTSIAFLLIIIALTRAFGDAGKGAALILMILQLSSGGGVLPVELSGGIYQVISPWLPFTYVVMALRSSMFGALEGGWHSAWAIIALGSLGVGVCACYVGKWKLVEEFDHRPAMDI
jgi:putative membrane protein